MSAKPALDGTDLELLALLQADARRSSADIAKRVSLSATAVTRRIKRLEEAGVIGGYTAIIDYARLGWAIEALIEVRFAGKTRPEEMDRTVSELREVVAEFTVSGNYDALVWVRVIDISHLTEVVDKLRVASRVIDTRTHVILASHRPRRQDALVASRGTEPRAPDAWGSASAPAP